MLYLFKNVYLTLDNSIEPATPCVFITPKASLIPTTEFEQLIAEVDLGHLIAQGETVEQASAAIGGDQQLFSALANNSAPRVYIYAAPAEFVNFAARWYKTTLPNLDAASAHVLMALTLSWLSNTLGYPYAPHKRLDDQSAAEYRALSAYLPTDVDGAWWDSLTPFDVDSSLLSQMVEDCGIEYQLATYLCDPTWEGSNGLLQKLKYMKETTRITFIIDTMRNVSLRPYVLPGFDIATDTVEKWVQRTGRLPILVDERVYQRDLEYVNANYTEIQLKDSLVEVMQLLGYDDGLNIIESVLFGDEVTIDDYLDTDRSLGFYSAIIATSARQQTVNTYVLNRLLNERGNAEHPFASTLRLTK